MPSIAHLAAAENPTIPETGGRYSAPMPQPYAQRLAEWADEQGISRHAEVTVTALYPEPGNPGGPVPPVRKFTRVTISEITTGRRGVDELSGWSLAITDSTARYYVSMRDGGYIDVRTTIPLKDHARRIESEAAPAYRLSAAASLEVKAAEQWRAAQQVRAVEIRKALDAGVPVRVIAENARVSEPRVYQIRDGRR